MRAMHWRVLAERMWTPETIQAFHLKPSQVEAGGRIAAYRTQQAAAEIHRILFEDD